MYARLIAAALLLASAGCASSGGNSSGPNVGQAVVTTGYHGIDAQLSGGGEALRDVVPAPVERVAAELPGVYQLLGFTAGRMDAEGRTVGTDVFDLRRRIEGRPHSVWLNCGVTSVGQSAADVHRVSMAIRSTVTPRPNGGSLVSTTVEASARASTGASSTPARCGSTGELERRIAELLRTRTAGTTGS